MTRKRRVAIKLAIMNSQLVVGVGNIYASEALFRAGIRPGRAAGSLTRSECAALVKAIKAVLGDAIKAGGTTLRDYVGAGGEPGYFAIHLRVYGRVGEPCPGLCPAHPRNPAGTALDVLLPRVPEIRFFGHRRQAITDTPVS